MKLLVIVFLNGGDLLSDVGKLANLVFNLVLKEAHLILEIVYAQLLEHHYLVVPVVTQQALETDRAQAVFAEGLNLLGLMDLASAFHELADLIVATHCLFTCWNLMCNLLV